MTDKESLLDKYTTDLTVAAAKHPDNYEVIDRDSEVQEVIYNLNRRTKNNPILLGDAGVGKTAIVEGLAKKIALKQAGDSLNQKSIRVLQVAALGQEERVAKFLGIINEVKDSHGQIILFIDEVHTIMGDDNTGGAMDLGDVLKPAMARGEIQLIGATTLDEFDKFIQRDPALERRFQPILIDEPSEDSAILILQGIKHIYEYYHHVTYTDKALINCVRLSMRYITDRYLPDKAIDLMDEAGAICHVRGRDKVTVRDIAEVLQRMTGIPISSILINDDRRLLGLSAKLHQSVKGQSQAINEVVDSIEIAKVGLQSPNKPLASFLFLGTTGVGKTALAKALTVAMFDDLSNMIRFDMAEFKSPDTLDKFQNLLTENIKHRPYSVLLFDEIEKANTQVHDLLLSVLDDGELRDKRGRMANFRNCILIMTSNLGADLITDKQTYDRITTQDTETQRKRKLLSFRKEVQSALTNVFRPEFVNRIDHKVVFNVLDRKVIRDIAKHDLELLNGRMQDKGYYLHYNDDVLDFLADIGTDEANGARPLARCIEREVTAPIAFAITGLRRKKSKINLLTIRIDGKMGALNVAGTHHLRGTRQIRVSGSVMATNQNRNEETA